MKHLLSAALLIASTSVFAQIQSPKASPLGKVEQKVGLTDLKVEYSRPSKNDRVIFGDVVPMNQLWRTGANENSKFTTSDAIVFGKDTLKPGTYALYTTPGKDSWDVIFYNDITNWGTPEKFEETKVALRTKAKVEMQSTVTETFTINFDNLKMNSANLVFEWDKTKASVAFTVPTDAKMMASITKVMGGPSANDYYMASDYYYNAKLDMNQALTYLNKYVEMKGIDEVPFYVLHRKALIQAELKDYKGALETAKLSLKKSEEAEYEEYIKMNKKVIEEWSKKVN